MDSQLPLLEVRSVAKRYESVDGVSADVLSGVSLTVSRGETAAIRKIPLSPVRAASVTIPVTTLNEGGFNVMRPERRP